LAVVDARWQIKLGVIGHRRRPAPHRQRTRTLKSQTADREIDDFMTVARSRPG